MHNLDKHPTMKIKMLFTSYVYALHDREKKIIPERELVRIDAKTAA